MKLYYFTENEFTRGGRDWFPDMDPRLLVLLDMFRHAWGQPVSISAHPDALGRIMGQASLSDHNFTRHGSVLAADVMPDGIETPDDAAVAVELANQVGFTAIGFYPHWRPKPGLHLGVRPDHAPGDPATWGAIMVDNIQKYISLEESLNVELTV